MAYYLGIDVGSSSVKLTCIDEAGYVVGSASETYGIAEPHPGWREIDPEVWWAAICAASKKLAANVDLHKVKGVGATGQMHTTVFVDSLGNATAPAIMWNDQRTLGSVSVHKDWAEQAGFDHIAKLIATGIPALNISWFIQNNPDAFSRTSTFLSVSDWVGVKLGCRAGTDYCGASTSALFDNESLSWSSEACDHFGISESMLPPIEKSDEVIGSVRRTASEEIGIPEGTPVVRGTGDNPAASICTGCLLDHCPTISLGTSGVLMYAKDGVAFPTAGKPVLFSWANDMKTLTQLSVRTCGGAKEWLYGKILLTESYDIEDKAVEDPHYDMRGIMFYPHMAGEKVLHSDPAVRGAFLGLDLNTTRSELQRALMEGTAFALRSLKEAVQSSGHWEEIRLVGGGSKNDFWVHALCNILGTKLVRLKTSGAGHGAALLALSAVEGLPLEEVAANSYELVDSITVDEEAHRTYDVEFATYQKIYSALKAM